VAVSDHDVDRLVEAIINAAMIRVSTIVSVAAGLHDRVGLESQPVTMEVARRDLRDAIRRVVDGKVSTP
jgi:hypothetical protein